MGQSVLATQTRWRAGQNAQSRPVALLPSGKRHRSDADFASSVSSEFQENCGSGFRWDSGVASASPDK